MRAKLKPALPGSISLTGVHVFPWSDDDRWLVGRRGASVVVVAAEVGGLLEVGSDGAGGGAAVVGGVKPRVGVTMWTTP